MKVLDKICLVIFSIIVLIMALVVCFIISGWLEISVVVDFATAIFSSKVGGPVSLGVSTGLAILAILCIFLNPNAKEKAKEGILLENENGKLLVSKSTIENLSNTVIKNYGSVESSNTRVDVDGENNIRVFITLSVYQEAVIKDLAAKIQTNIKDEVKKSLDLEIKEVNIRVRNINPKKENTVVKE